MSLNPSQSYLISAGEFSGDLLAAELVLAIRTEAPDLKSFGIVGNTMSKAGVTPLADISELSVMGVVEVAKRILDIRILEQRILAWVDRNRPQFAVLVDFPGFHFRLAEQLHLRGIPVYQYVAPKVWAWGQSRVLKLRDNFQAVLGVLPFEEEFFLRHGVRYHYMGSPHLDRMSLIQVKPSNFGFNDDQKIIAFLPGSRLSELKKILPVMIKIRQEIARLDPSALCVVPLASGLNWRDVTNLMGLGDSERPNAHKWSAGGFVWFAGASLELMKIARGAVVASGTATLECALAGTPMVVVYVMNELSFAIAKRAVSLKWVSLVNLLMNQFIVNEYLQNIDPVKVAAEILNLTENSAERTTMIQHFDRLQSKLEHGAAEKSAKFIVNDLKFIGSAR